MEEVQPNQSRDREESPIPHDPALEWQQQEIIGYLHQGNVNEAFRKALSASDPSMLTHVCKMVDPTVLFGAKPCPLRRPVLVSLIQHLSRGLERKDLAELLTKYLFGAIMNLDLFDADTGILARKVLESLVNSLEARIANLISKQLDSVPNTPIVEQMQMLAIAEKSFNQGL